jgi:hypothetical protein
MYIINAYDLSPLPTIFLSSSHRKWLASPESLSHILLKETLLVNNSKGKIIT